ncbi:MAG: hypothetical protein ACOCG4_04215 [Methanoculleus sp.]|jgi:hypothetical protein|nr:hypothetical protein [Methanomicrobiales archaeon]NQS73229.1 hypothetical protein [Methanoculleus sp.]
MRWVTAGVVLMLIAVLAAPAAAGSDERYSYITVENVTVRLLEEDAVVTINYQIDSGIGLLVLLLGKSDLRQKVLDVLNFEGARVQTVDLEHAVVHVKNASNDYGRGSYWFPEHRFGVVVPSLTIVTPHDTKHYEKVSEITGGLGYFSTN